MKSLGIKVALCALLLSAVAASSFGGRKNPPPDPKFLAIEKIVVLPVVDLREGKKDKVNLESLRKGTVKRLQHKNYAIGPNDNVGTNGEIIEEDLSDAKPAWVQHLGPSDARWVMVIGLGEAHSQITFGSSGNAQVVGYLFDKQDGSVVWKGTGIGQVGQGGLMGMTMKGFMKSAALDGALNNLLSSIPKIPKKKK